MYAVRDNRNRVACMIDKTNGIVEHRYKGCFTQSVLPVGGSYVIERDNTRTVIVRTGKTKYEVRNEITG